MVVVQDAAGNVFGGFMTQGFALKDAFFGTGDSFVFKAAPDGVYTYVATSLNELYCFADADGFGFGSEPHYGLFVDHSLLKGFSFACQTYKNEPLSTSDYFAIDRLEVWGFQPRPADDRDTAGHPPPI